MSELKYIHFSTKEHFTDDITVEVKNLEDLKTLITTSDYKDSKWYKRGIDTIKNVLFTSSIKNLKSLDLNNNSIGDGGAKALAGALHNNTSLLGLYLANNNIGVDGAKALAGALQNKTSLRNLSLSSNSIGDDGAKALAGALHNNTSLNTLSLGSNSIGVDGERYYYYMKSTYPKRTILLTSNSMPALKLNLIQFTSDTINSYKNSEDALFLVDSYKNNIIIDFSSKTEIDLSNITNDKVKILLYDIVSANNIDLKVSNSETILNDIPITPIYKSINITGEGILDNDIKSFCKKLNKVYEFTNKSKLPNPTIIYNNGTRSINAQTCTISPLPTTTATSPTSTSTPTTTTNKITILVQNYNNVTLDRLLNTITYTTKIKPNNDELEAHFMDYFKKNNIDTTFDIKIDENEHFNTTTYTVAITFKSDVMQFVEKNLSELLNHKKSNMSLYIILTIIIVLIILGLLYYKYRPF